MDTTYTREQAFKEINETQDFYINELINALNSKENETFKVLTFKSATGTGKTKMMAKLINKMPDFFFIITSLSKGQLHLQIKANLEKDVINSNFAVYGVADFKISSKLQADDILSLIPDNKQFIWLRDEGHINTNKWETLLIDRAFKTINFTATPKEVPTVDCNFTHTMMLRTVQQQCGTPEDAILKLLEVKKQHSKVAHYNPCLIARCIDNEQHFESIAKMFIDLCNKYNLKYIDITNNHDYVMQDLCKDDNEYDVIINKFKITEGIDIRRAHIIYMDNQPKNPATTIQVIGRARRNALLYNSHIDIFAKSNKALLKNTRTCTVFYNIANMKIDQDQDGELCNAFCDTISVQNLKPNTKITLVDGIMPNGLKIIEANEQSGTFEINETNGFNYISSSSFYTKRKETVNPNISIHIKWSRFNKLDKKQMLLIPYKEFKENWVKRKALCETWGSEQPYKLLDNWIYSPILLKDNSKISFDDSNIIKTKYFKQLENRLLAFKYSSYELDAAEIDGYPWYLPYTKITNDRESAIVGTDYMKLTSDNNWIEDKAITSKITKASKLNTFISNKYSEELKTAKNLIFNGKNNFKFNSKCNSILGYCVEYYSKYLVYGDAFLKKYIIQALKESHCSLEDYNNINIIIRACMLCYRDTMKKTYGNNVAKLIKTVSVSQLIRKEFKLFVDTVVQLGTKTATFIKSTCPDLSVVNEYGDLFIHDPNLSIQHISGLADYLSADTIIDIKTTNNITMQYVKQVLGYHYLSTKRSDLHIKKVIIFDAVSGKNVTIPISDENQN